MMPSLIGTVLFIISWQIYKYWKDEKDSDSDITPIFEVGEPAPVAEVPEKTVFQTHDIVMTVLQELQCKTEEDEDGIYFRYQGENFRIMTSKEEPFVSLFDFFWERVKLEDLDAVANMRKVINEINWMRKSNVCYSKNKTEKTLDIHTMHRMLCDNKEIFKDYLQMMMEECFLIHRDYKFRMLLKETHRSNLQLNDKL